MNFAHVPLPPPQHDKRIMQFTLNIIAINYSASCFLMINVFSYSYICSICRQKNQPKLQFFEETLYRKVLDLFYSM